MKSGSFALITGASSGIGQAYARHLAAKHHNLILVARRRERLETLAATLKQHYAIDVEYYTADLSLPTGRAEVIHRIMKLDSLDILINNAGFGTSGPFADVAWKKHVEMIQVHVVACMELCHAALPSMIQRKRGALINVSSIAAFLPGPGNTTYAATKHAMVTFSESLQSELSGTGIAIQALCPGFTVTEFHDTVEFQAFDRTQVPRYMWMSADDVVIASLKALRHPHVTYIPGWQNRLLVAMTQSRIKSIVRPLLNQIRRRIKREPSVQSR
jgi:uncharacterized protein